uniref:Uncharacterized protein n=1 Tax=Rhizophora mucronata TaxID=61149 RepID=A0A2P2NZT3_RHIMU
MHPACPHHIICLSTFSIIKHYKHFDSQRIPKKKENIMRPNNFPKYTFRTPIFI